MNNMNIDTVDTYEFVCPITAQIMFAPVKTNCCKQSFEKEALEQWLEKNTSCPNCRGTPEPIQPNFQIAHEIKVLLQNNISLKKEQFIPKALAKVIALMMDLGIFNEVKGLLKNNPDLSNIPLDTEGNTIIHKLVEFGFVEPLESIVELHPNWQVKNNNNVTPLMLAAYYQKIEIVNFLINKKVNLNEKSKNGNTALHYAASKNNHLICRILINKGADILSNNQKDQMALDLPTLPEAKVILEIEYAKYILDLFKDKEISFPYMDLLAKINSREGLAYFFKNLILDYPEQYLRIKQAKWMQLLKSNSNNTLHELMVLFQDIISDPIASEQMNLLENLIEQSPCDLKLIEQLIKFGANVNYINCENQTPLMQAVVKGDKKLVELLLSNGAKIDLQDVKGETALFKAAFHRHKEIYDLLLNNNANKFLKNKGGHSAVAAYGLIFKDFKAMGEAFMQQSSTKGRQFIHQLFFKYYNPGILGGSMRKFKKDPNHAEFLDSAIEHAEKNPESATANALINLINYSAV